MFDEASLAGWRGRDLREAHRIPNFDILVVAVRKVHLMVPANACFTIIEGLQHQSVLALENSLLFTTTRIEYFKALSFLGQGSRNC